VFILCSVGLYARPKCYDDSLTLRMTKAAIDWRRLAIVTSHDRQKSSRGGAENDGYENQRCCKYWSHKYKYKYKQ